MPFAMTSLIRKWGLVDVRNLVSVVLLFAVTIFPATVGASTADVKRGEKLYKACKSCHQVGPNAKNSVGPHLNDIFGRRAGSLEGVRYSEDIIRAGVNGLHWDYVSLDSYLENPRNLVSGTRMQYRGLKEEQDRADIIAYLREFSDKPSDIPEAAPTAMVTGDPEIDPAILAIQGDPAYGEYLAGECTTCHQASGNDEGIPSIVGWPSDIFVTAMHAYRSKARAHPVMRMIATDLNDEQIAALAAYFEMLGPN